MDPRPPCVMITGASGFVGRHLVKALLRRLPAGGRLVAVGLSGQAPEGAEPVIADVTDESALRAAIAAHKPTAVMHLAAVAEPAKAKAAPREAWDINLFGTMNLAYAVMDAAPEALFVHASTSDVYGESFIAIDGPLGEEAPLVPLTTYGATKAAADILVRQLAADDLRSVRFRPFNHTGPGQSDRYVVAGFAAQIARIERGLQPPVVEVGNLDAERDILDVRDVVEAYAICLLGEAAPDVGSVFNLASGRPRRIGDLLDAMIAMSRSPIETRIDAARVRNNDIPRTWGDASRAGTELGWKASIAIEDTLAAVLADQRLAPV